VALNRERLYFALSYKRLDEAGFCWPRLEDGVIRLSSAQLMALVDGMDWTRIHAPRRRRPQSLG